MGIIGPNKFLSIIGINLIVSLVMHQPLYAYKSTYIMYIADSITVHAHWI